MSTQSIQSVLSCLRSGWSIISSNDLSAAEIAVARAEGRLFVNDDGLNYVHVDRRHIEAALAEERTKRERAEAQLEEAEREHDDAKFVADEMHRGAAAMREALERIDALACSPSALDPIDMSRYSSIARVARAALASDAGKGWVAPETLDEAFQVARHDMECIASTGGALRVLSELEREIRAPGGR